MTAKRLRRMQHLLWLSEPSEHGEHLCGAEIPNLKIDKWLFSTNDIAFATFN